MPPYQETMSKLGYYHLDKSQSPVNRKDIEELEQQFGVQLPGDYREFAINFAGTSFTGFVSTPLANEIIGEPLAVELFYGFFQNEASPYDLRYINKQLASWLSKSYLSIASAHYGNFFSLSLQAKNFGVVHFWEGETDPIFVASNFDSFLRSLLPEPSHEV